MVLAGLLSLVSCMPSLRSEMTRVHAEIEELQRELPENAPLWISAKDLPNYPNLKPEDAFERYVQDHTQSIPAFVLHHIMGKLAALSEKEIENLSKGDFPHEASLMEPDAFRGNIYRITGVVLSLEYTRIKNSAAPMKDIYSGAAAVDSSRAFLFYVTTKPDVLYLSEDLIELHGVFVKLITTGPEGNRITVPVFFGRAIKKYL